MGGFAGGSPEGFGGSGSSPASKRCSGFGAGFVVGAEACDSGFGAAACCAGFAGAEACGAGVWDAGFGDPGAPGFDPGAGAWPRGGWPRPCCCRCIRNCARSCCFFCHSFSSRGMISFTSFIDTLGGIDIQSDERLKLDPMGSGKDHFVMKCCQTYHLNGKRALAYARCRDASQGCSDGDVGRAKRQQQVILAVRDKVFEPANFTKLMAQAPQLYSMFSAGIHTNMSLEDAIKLAALAKDIPMENIKRGVIDDDMVSPANVTLNEMPASILRPIPDLIRVLRDEIFSIGEPTGPLAQGDPAALMRADAAKIRVVNNTYTADLDARTGNYLIAQGMQVTERGTPTGASNQTMIVLYSPKLYALRYLINTFGITSSDQIVTQPNIAETVDIEIRLGQDWVDRLPSGY